MESAHFYAKVSAFMLFGACFFWMTLVGARSWTEVLKAVGWVFLALLGQVAIDTFSFNVSLIGALEGKTSLVWGVYGLAAGLALGVVVNLFRRKLTVAGTEEMSLQVLRPSLRNLRLRNMLSTRKARLTIRSTRP